MALGAGHIGNLGGDSYLYLVKKQRFFQQAIETLEHNECQPGDVINAYNKTVDKSGCSPTITTRPEGFKTAILPVVREENKNMEEEKKEEVQEEKKAKYAIRKLTPKECFRLMNFSDEDFEKAKAVNSNSQLYKQAGNSIVRAVLIAIFSQLGIQGHKKWNEMTLEERRALAYKGTILEAK